MKNIKLIEIEIRNYFFDLKDRQVNLGSEFAIDMITKDIVDILKKLSEEKQKSINR
jgi:hypothetical protein